MNGLSFVMKPPDSGACWESTATAASLTFTTSLPEGAEKHEQKEMESYFASQWWDNAITTPCGSAD